MAVLSHFEPLQWEKIGKVVNWAKLVIPSHSELLQWEKIEKVVNHVKLAILSHSEPLWWEKIGKVVNWVKLAILRGGQILRICQNPLIKLKDPVTNQSRESENNGHAT